MDAFLPPRAETKPPALKVPPLSCDCHMHIFGPAARFPYTPQRSFTPAVAFVLVPTGSFTSRPETPPGDSSRNSSIRSQEKRCD